jgi:hypothetical protein
MTALSLRSDPPLEYPLTLDLIKRQLRIGHDEFDDIILGTYLPAALSWAEGETRRSIARKAYYWTLKGFPRGAIRLPAGVCRKVHYIQYGDNYLYGPSREDLTTSPETPAGEDFLEDLSADFGGVIWPAESWPDVDREQRVVIKFDAGWSRAECPADIKLALTAYIQEAIDVTGGADIPNNFSANLKTHLLSGWVLR